jgi:hypothetical protein
MTADFEPYPPPLDGLNALDLDETDHFETIDYRTVGITETDVPALIRIAINPRFDTAPLPAAWAPLQACRALGMLGAVEAIDPLLTLLDQRGDRRLGCGGGPKRSWRDRLSRANCGISR